MTATRGRWLAAARQVLDRIEASQMEAIAEAAQICADAIAPGGFVHMFGTGHSRIPVEEMFPRYGSFPGFHPIAELSMTFHTQIAGANGQRQAMFIERVEGLAEAILSNFHFRSTDAMIVCSASGSTAVPIEMAAGAQLRGLPVIVLTSVAQSQAADPQHSSGTRLLDHADVVIDLCTPPADAMVNIDGIESPVGPGTTVAYAAIINEIKCQTAALLVLQDAMPEVITSSAVVGREQADRLFESIYQDHARRLAGALAGSETTDAGMAFGQ